MASVQIQRHVAIYTRQSRSTSDEFSSRDAQFEICQEFLSARQGWVWCGTRYDDEGESGESLDRPGLNQLLHQVRAGALDGIVVYRLDRLSRRLKDITALLSEFRDRGIQLLVVADPSLGTSATNMLLLHLLGSFAEFEHEIIRERLADTRAAMKRRGLRVAGRVPYGYAIAAATKQLIPNAWEAKRVRKIFGWAAEGKKLTEIAGLANQRNWRTKSSKRYPNGGRWTPRQVADLLANPVYIGMIRVKAGAAPGQHEALIDKELFDQVRNIVSARRVSTTRRQAANANWHLRGIVVCARCRRSMSTSVLHHRQFRYLFYRCRSHAGGRPPCKGVSVPAFELDQLVCKQLTALDPQKLRLPSRRQFVADFAKLWSELNDREQVRCLRDVIEQVEFDAKKGTLRISLHPGAVGSLAGFVMNRESEA